MIPGVRRLDHREVGLEDRVDEDDEDVLVDVRLRELDRSRRPVLHDLLDEHRRQRELRLRVLLDLLLQVAGDVDDLVDAAQSLEILEDVGHHRLAGDLQHRLRHEMRVRPEARPFAGQRDDHFHGALVPSRP